MRVGPDEGVVAGVVGDSEADPSVDEAVDVVDEGVDPVGGAVVVVVTSALG